MIQRLKTILIILIFIIIGFLVYSNTMEAPFFFDDIPRIKNNIDIHITDISIKSLLKAISGKDSEKTRPFGYLSFALNYYFHKSNLKYFHITNIIIHILSGIFLFFFIKTTLYYIGYNLPKKNQENKLQSKKNGSNQSNKIDTISDTRKNITSLAFFSALIWLVHPLHTQSVTYIVQRLNSMAALFFLLSFLFFIKGRLSIEGLTTNRTIPAENYKQANSDYLVKEKKNRKKKKRNKTDQHDFNISNIPHSLNRAYYTWFPLAAIAWFISLGCKQNAAMLPFFIFLYEYYFFRDLDRKWLLKNLKWLAGVLILFGIIALIFLGHDPVQKLLSLRDFNNNEFTYSERILTQPRVVIYYLSLIFFPHPSRLRLEYDFALSHSLISPITTILCLGLIVGIIYLAIINARKKRLLSFCIIWFFGNLVIESSAIPLAIIYEHRTYLPSMLVILFAVILIYEFIKPKWIRIVLLAAIISIFSFWTYERNKIWKDEISLWSDIVEKSPANYTAHTNLGIALDRKGMTDKAIPHYFTAINLEPDYAEAHNNLGIALEKSGKLKEALDHYLEALKLDPRDENAQNNLGLFMVRQKRYDEAIEYFHEALRLRPHFPAAHFNLGIAFLNLKRPADALVHFKEVEQLFHNNPDVYYYLGVSLAMMERYKEAADYFNKTLQLDPNNMEVKKYLDYVLTKIK